MRSLAGRESRDDAYRDVPADQRERLFTFRATHAYRQLTVEGATWRYIACGEGERALLFLPGAFMRADMWFNQILAFEGDYRVVAPDAYALQDVFDVALVCDALVKSLDAEGIEKATVIGMSAGGGVAQVLLQRHPERVEHVVFSHCGVLEACAEAERKTRRTLRPLRLLPPFIIRRVLRRMTTGHIPASSRWIVFHEAYVEEALLDVEKAMVVRFLRSGLETRRRFVYEPEVLASWPGSILLLASRDDALAQPTLEKLQARYPRAETKLLEKGGHHTFLFFPEAYTAALRGFLHTASSRDRGCEA